MHWAYGYMLPPPCPTCAYLNPVFVACPFLNPKDLSVEVQGAIQKQNGHSGCFLFFLFFCCARIIVSVRFIHSSFSVLYTYVYKAMKKVVGNMMGLAVQ